ncbi:hypothetical protein SAMN05421821_10679 [Mucilaginibacter lappiensis]|uniref:Peptidase C39-like domain-containing protein n=1 Tax=Mucilaginibacter lappiensis TaxID=354630 RepID=A0ABR6PKG7_9SPHI|nr:hypothetical protein [Mucilaginibacter lappiensis]MBB6110272.1 hypothetical protein [Mucilaginibacter lappiensis]SIR28665.1 hypothetical protein SAMN05421821_10679 [Mucilaginibacter lappiensis]
MKNLDELTLLFPEMEQKRQQSTLGGDVYDGGDHGIAYSMTGDPGVTIYGTPITPPDQYSGPGFNNGGPGDNGGGGGNGGSDGGYTGVNTALPNGYCFFNALAYESKQYHCNTTDQQYLDMFKQEFGADSVNSAGNIDPRLASNFATEHFQGQVILSTDSFQSFLKNGYQIITDIKTGPNTYHEIVITGYDSTLNMYKTTDPTNNDNLSYADPSSVNQTNAFAVGGCK